MHYGIQRPGVRMSVRPPADCPQWSREFQAAGWRPFGSCDRRTGIAVWLLKRGCDVVAFTQSVYGAMDQTIRMPDASAEEVTALMLRSGLAVPA